MIQSEMEICWKKKYSREVNFSTIDNETENDNKDKANVSFRHFKRAKESNLKQYADYQVMVKEKEIVKPVNLSHQDSETYKTKHR